MRWAMKIKGIEVFWLALIRSHPGHVRMLPVTRGYAVVPPGGLILYNNYNQLASHNYAAIWQKKGELNSKF